VIVIKEPALAINKGLFFTVGFVHKVKSSVVLSMRLLIHSDSFYLVITSSPK